MASDLLHKLDDVIKLQLESKADIEALGRKAVWMAQRIADLEARLRIWRDDYERCDGFTSVKIPVHQIITLIGEK